MNDMSCEKVIIKDGSRVGTAFICGRKTHECNTAGPMVLVLADGAEIEDTEVNRVQYQDDIRGGSVSCSVCGTSAISQAPWL